MLCSRSSWVCASSTHAIWARIVSQLVHVFRCWNLLLNCFTSSQVIYQNFLTTSCFFFCPSNQQMISSASDAAMAIALANARDRHRQRLTMNERKWKRKMNILVQASRVDTFCATFVMHSIESDSECEEQSWGRASGRWMRSFTNCFKTSGQSH